MRATAGVPLAALLLCGCPPRTGSPENPPPTTPCDLDPALSPEACAALHDSELSKELPAAAGNAYGDDLNAALLGFSIFFDARFSANQNVRCASCHLPERKFGDGKATSTAGLQGVIRNAPTVINAARHRAMFWDGRADSLWSQPLFAFENPREMGFSRLEVAHLVATLFRPAYEPLFGPLPPLSDDTRFPARGLPGDPAFEGMTPADQAAVNRVVANVGKALEAYHRKLATGRAVFDRFLAGDTTALTPAQRAGMVAFARNGCLTCHGGPTFSDEKFHNLGVAAWPGDALDPGRAGAWSVLNTSPFTAGGVYWDGPPPPAQPPPGPQDEGAFRTPTLRNVTLSAPYLHNGRAATLRDAILAHVPAARTDPAAFLGTTDDQLPLALDALDVEAMLDFLAALKGEYPLPPWNDWPQR